MSPLQQIAHDLTTGDAYSLIVIFAVGIGTVLRHIKHPEAEIPGWKGIVNDTGLALLQITGVFVVKWWFGLLLGDHYVEGGILLRMFFYGHLTVAVNWLIKIMLRYFP
jgi:hypothetical protein